MLEVDSIKHKSAGQPPVGRMGFLLAALFALALAIGLNAAIFNGRLLPLDVYHLNSMAQHSDCIEAQADSISRDGMIDQTAASIRQMLVLRLIGDKKDCRIQVQSDNQTGATGP